MGSSDIVVVSNRGPLSFDIDRGGALVRKEAGGGLAGALEPLLAGTGAHWICAAMSQGDREAVHQGLMKADGMELHAVEADEAVYKMAYDVVSNSTLWFSHHHLFDLTRRPRIDRFWRQAWEGYRELNHIFAAEVLRVAPVGAAVLVQDYHLCLLPQMVKSEREDLRVVHFSHTPFADPNQLRVLPVQAARELLSGMAAAHACGFHTRRWAEAFEACCSDNAVKAPNTFSSPLSPDAGRLAARVSSSACAAASERIRALVGDRLAVVSVDRVEPSKNLLRGIWSFDEMLRARPELRSKVTMLALAYLSRQGLPEYLSYGTELEHATRIVNEAWGDASWSPILLDVADDPDRSFAALTLYDVLLVNPVRDGLNLVAKEGPLVNSTDGVLALSREAGAFAELGAEALELNPFDVAGTADALAQGLLMERQERRRRAGALRDIVNSRTPEMWLQDQLANARN